ncbi:hypothetical protein NUW54_g8078 [Trametes sanguinea]|uniref:Uncharacterized protein n=1 Tax=Trametes sanguinea TaxID=158606 RepID=A0ACC1PHV6_9APHY|nr:hypothetical protein NUW54_g8078 [Trametes sanguinea]
MAVPSSPNAIGSYVAQENGVFPPRPFQHNHVLASVSTSTPVVDSCSPPVSFPMPPESEPFQFTFNAPSPLTFAVTYNPPATGYDPFMPNIVDAFDPSSLPISDANSPDIHDMLTQALNSYPIHAHTTLPYTAAMSRTDTLQLAIPESAIEQASTMNGLNTNTPSSSGDITQDFLNLSSPVEREDSIPVARVSVPSRALNEEDCPNGRAGYEFSMDASQLLTPPAPHHSPASRPRTPGSHLAGSPFHSRAASPPSSAPSSPSSHTTSSRAVSPPLCRTSAPPCTPTRGHSGIAPSRSAHKRKQSHADLDSSDEADRNLTFVENPKARTKTHNKRARVLMKKAMALNVVSKPYLLVYCARPESVCHKNGVAITFISDNLKPIVGADFVRNLHAMVMQGTHNALSNAQVALQTNLEVERLRREKEEETARRVAAEAQVNEMQRRLDQLGLHDHE